MLLRGEFEVPGLSLLDAPWVPSPLDTVRNMLRLADVREGERVYDLGSGDGRVLAVAATEFGARAVGVELNPLAYLWSRLFVLLKEHGGEIEVRWTNLFDVDLRDADVVTMYLVQKTNIRLMPKLSRELRHGARVVSNAFNFPGWKHVAQVNNIRLYCQPFVDQ